MGTISKNFDFAEFEASDTADRLGIDNSLPDEEKEAVIALVKTVLQPLRDKAGALTVNSGYRCKALNKAVGGVDTSQHVKGEAADIAAENPYQLAKMAIRLPFDQMILYPTFVHFSHRLEGRQRGMILYNYRYTGKKL